MQGRSRSSGIEWKAYVLNDKALPENASNSTIENIYYNALIYRNDDLARAIREKYPFVGGKSEMHRFLGYNCSGSQSPPIKRRNTDSGSQTCKRRASGDDGVVVAIGRSESFDCDVDECDMDEGN